MKRWRLLSPGLLAAVLMVGLYLNHGRASATLQKPQTVVNTFDRGPEGWQVYDYNGGIAGGGNVFYAATWEKSGGVRDTGYIWGDDSRWRIDTPEKPHSILPFILYRDWLVVHPFKPAQDGSKGEPLDLREAEVSVYLRGDQLDLKGAKCYFWTLNHPINTRWHYQGHPLPISQGRWGDKVTFVLKNEESLWYRSWSKNPQRPASLDQVLRSCDSYGFSFVGFSGEVTGRFAMDQFEIKLKPNPRPR